MPWKHLYSTCCYKMVTGIRFDLVLINWDRIALIKPHTFCQPGSSAAFSKIVVT